MFLEDVNPIGGIKKVDLRDFLLWAHQNIGLGRGNNVLQDTALGLP